MFQLTFETDNAVFDSENEGSTDDKLYEISRILTKVNTQVIQGYTDNNILDINGNVIGSWGLI